MKHDMPADTEEVFSQCMQLGLTSVPGEFPERVSIFLDLLSGCRNRMNLTGPYEMKRIWHRHVLESVAFAGFLGGSSVVDIGTGAGFPGLILAMLGYDTILVEPRRRRCAFLEVAARECGIGSEVRILEGRIEEAGPFPAGTEFTAKSVKDTSRLIPLIAQVSGTPFRLLTRAPDTSLEVQQGFRVTALPVPPLDRPGFLVQYSHS